MERPSAMEPVHTGVTVNNVPLETENNCSKSPITPLSQSPPSSGFEILLEKGNPHGTQKGSLKIWINTVWTLVIHGILSVGVALFVLLYVKGRHFNLSERTPLVHVIAETRVSPFRPTQSDIVTLLSSVIAMLKCALAAWAGSLCWYVSLFLMGRRGLPRRDLKALVKYGLLAPGVYSQDWTTWIIGSLLTSCVAAAWSSPILTGSISWVPSNELAQGLSLTPTFFSTIENDVMRQLPLFYQDNYYVREEYAIKGAGGVGIEWGREPEKGAVKRISHEIWPLALNSTIQNTTLPYFKVHSITWIENRTEIPGIRDGITPTDLLDAYFQTTPSRITGFPIGHAVLVPNVTTIWSNDPLDLTVIHDTRLLILCYARDSPSSSGIHIITKDLPASAYKLKSKPSYYAFAWVTFSAGVGRCKDYNCFVSSPSTIQNATPIELEPHQLTYQTLSMATVTGMYMVIQNNSLPYLWGNINDYIEAVLVRSYSGSWCQLNKAMRTSILLADYVPSLPSLLAHVDQRRVYVWLGLQLLVTLFSILYMFAQSHLSEYPPMGDTSLTAFDLDTTGVYTDETDPLINREWKVEIRDNRLRMKVE